jgi:ABC-2 type transport system permease protein
VALRLLGEEGGEAGVGGAVAAPRDGELPYRLPGEGATFDTPLDLNLIGLWTLYLKEVRRFFKVWTQTLLAPVITTLVFLAIFALAMHRAEATIGGLPFLRFLAPGLIMMAIVQNAFANTSSSIVIAKIQGNIVDYLMPPLGPGELLLGLAAGGVTRGLFVGLAVYVSTLPFVALPPLHPFLILYYVLASSLMLSLLGILGGLWSEKFDQVAAVTNFVVTPLSFLSGTFYSVEALPAGLHWVAFANPFFYMIDGIRYAFTGHADGSVALGLAMLAVVNAGLWWWCHELIRRGYKLKA